MAEVIEKTSAASPASASSADAAGVRPASAQQNTRQTPGLAFTRHFTEPGVSPYDKLTWERRTAAIIDSKGKVIFEQKDVEVPQDWSMTATNIVASKYLHGQLGTPQRETGMRQLVSRVAETIRDWGMKDGYFRSGKMPKSSTMSWYTCCSISTRRSIRRYGSTLAAIASSPTRMRRTGTGIRSRSELNSA